MAVQKVGSSYPEIGLPGHRAYHAKRGSKVVLRYPIGNSGQLLVISDKVIKHFNRHRQRRAYQTEAGGQLFARFEGAEVVIELVTGPRPTDKRGRTYYHPDRRAEQQEIEQIYALGLHFIGDWHTHASLLPEPSWIDLKSIRDSFRRSHHQLNGFALVIVGTAKGLRGLRVSIVDGENDYVLQALDNDDKIAFS
jgi:integrative and conjugative element protein (TIGR02256 family)